MWYVIKLLEELLFCSFDLNYFEAESTAKVKHFPSAKTSHARKYLSSGQLNSKKEKKKKIATAGKLLWGFFPRIKNSLTGINLPLSQSQDGLFLFNI